jgi:membrane-bound lytic murein transglycosylase MltF
MAAASEEAVVDSNYASLCLNYQLESVREEFSKYLQEMQNALGKITVIISYCESHWDMQINKIGDIIKKLERNGQGITKPTARSISAKAEDLLAKSESYSVIVRQALNRDLMLAVRIL